MNFKKLLLVPFLAFAITACGNDCKSQCNDANDCPGVTKKADCDKLCDDLEKLADDAGCSDQWDDVASCESDQDACKADSSTACKSQSDKYSACLLPYCMKNADKCSAALGNLGSDS